MNTNKNLLFNHIRYELSLLGLNLNEKVREAIMMFSNVIADLDCDNETVNSAINLINKSILNKPWSPIKLNDDHFQLDRHYRCWFIRKDLNGIYNQMAYLLKERKSYIVNGENDVCEIPMSILGRDGEFIDERIYISKGGIINGDYVHKCYLKHQEGEYVVRDPIKIPISTIEFKNSPEVIFFVDHREPKLKALMEFYDVKIKHDDKVKFNVRTFKKIK